MKIPYLMHADAMKLKTLAENAISPNPEMGDPATPPETRQVCISAFALLSLIEQAHSPQLGLATTKEISDEYDARVVRGDHISQAPDYKTFDPHASH